MVASFVVAELIHLARFQAAVVLGIEAGVLSIGDLEPTHPKGVADDDRMSGTFVGVTLLGPHNE
jgi:hypothetical protein